MKSLTKKISKTQLEKKLPGFISWYQDSVFEQREVGKMLSIGRDSSQGIVVDDPFVSRYHARIENGQEKDGGYFIRDMSSRNGVLLNGNRIYKALLKNNDRIKIGQTEFIFSTKRFNHNWTVFHTSLNKDWNVQLSRIPAMSESGFPVLILGPSGTGKEYLAQMIHTHSSRSLGPYVSVNCSALTETLAESEFFGHLKGSFTGAERERKGAFLAANKGTLFLDEVGDLPLQIQPKLLRALENNEIKAVGSDQPIKVDTRIIAATHQDLAQKVYDKTFREDLYFRLRVLEVKPPALKNRMEDFDNILDYFLTQMGISFSTEVRQKISTYSWPGNIRELKNVVLRAKALFSGKVIEEKHLREIMDFKYDTEKISIKKTGELPLLKQVEKETILRILNEKKGNQRQASLELKVPRTTLRKKIIEYGINLDKF